MSGALPLFLLYGLTECTGKTLSLLNYACLTAQYLVLQNTDSLPFNTFVHILSLCFCTVHCNIIIQHKPTKSTLSELIFQFLILMSCTCLEPEGSSSGRRLYIQVWNRVFYMHHYKHAGKALYTIPVYTTVFLKMEELSCSTHVEDIKN
jgi:hypothetical protein